MPCRRFNIKIDTNITKSDVEKPNNDLGNNTPVQIGTGGNEITAYSKPRKPKSCRNYP